MKNSSEWTVDVYAKTQAFFEAVICEDLVIQALINSAEGNINFIKGQLVFDLPSLHRVVFPLNEVGYSEFKRMLYSSELNKKLMQKGVLVEVWRSANNDMQGKVDTNLYCLQRNIK